MEKQTPSFISWEKLRDIDLVGFLASIGHEPTKVRGVNYWYRSPLRNEKTPSFKVNRRLNRWYDFGIGKGGSIIDFCQEFYGADLPEIVQILSAHTFTKPVFYSPKEASSDESVLKVTGVYELSSWSLVNYLQKRGIPAELAGSFVKEVRYQLKDKSYYGLGFQNDAGGYEIRSPHFKGSSTPKAVTTVSGGHRTLSVFEGFFDFLSYQVLCQQKNWPETDYLILNSLSLVERSLDQMLPYRQIELYLDHDPAGRKATEFLKNQSPAFRDQSFHYNGHQDLNEFLTKQKTKRKVSRKLRR